MIYDKPKILVIFKIVSMLRLDIIPKFCTPLLLKVTFKFENGRNSIFFFSHCQCFTQSIPEIPYLYLYFFFNYYW